MTSSSTSNKLSLAKPTLGLLGWCYAWLRGRFVMRRQNRRVRPICLGVASIMVAVACGDPRLAENGIEQPVPSSDQRDAESQRLAGHGDAARLDVEVGQAPDSSSLLLTAKASKIMARVEGCASGFSKTYGFGVDVVRLYKGDRGCQGKILQFEFAGVLYSLPAGSVFDSQLGGITRFVSAQGLSVNLQVVKPLPAIVQHEHDDFIVNLVPLEKAQDAVVMIDQNIFTLSAAVSRIEENAGKEVLITVQRVTRRQSDKQVRVDLSFQGDAELGRDYEVSAQRLTFRNDEDVKTIKLNVVNDDLEEGDEVIAIALAPASNYVSYGQLFLVISANDSLPTFGALTLALRSDAGLDMANFSGGLRRWLDQSGHGLHAEQALAFWQPRIEASEFGAIPAVILQPLNRAHLRLPAHPRLANGSSYSERTHGLVLTTGKDIRNLQLIYYQGTPLGQGYNLYIDDQRLYFCLWSPGPQGASCLSRPIKAQRSYVVLAGFSQALGQQWLQLGQDEEERGFGGPLQGSAAALAQLGSSLDQPFLPSHRGLIYPLTSFLGQLGACLIFDASLNQSQRDELTGFLNGKFDL